MRERFRKKRAMTMSYIPVARLRWGMSRAELEKRILRLHKGGTGILKIGMALGIGTGTVQRVVSDGAAAPFRFDVAEAAFASQ